MSIATQCMVRLNHSNTIQTMVLPVSNRFPEPMRNLILERVPKTDSNKMVICPIYGTPNDPTDFQIGMTGTCKVNELQEHATERELREELGLSYTLGAPDTVTDIRVNVIDVEYGRYYTTYSQHYFSYLLNLSDGKMIQQQLTNDNRRDNRNLKVAALVVGTLDEAVDFLSKQTHTPDDDICGYAAVSIAVCRDLATNYTKHFDD